MGILAWGLNAHSKWYEVASGLTSCNLEGQRFHCNSIHIWWIVWIDRQIIRKWNIDSKCKILIQRSFVNYIDLINFKMSFYVLFCWVLVMPLTRVVHSGRCGYYFFCHYPEIRGIGKNIETCSIYASHNLNTNFCSVQHASPIVAKMVWGYYGIQFQMFGNRVLQYGNLK